MLNGLERDVRDVAVKEHDVHAGRQVCAERDHELVESVGVHEGRVRGIEQRVWRRAVRPVRIDALAFEGDERLPVAAIGIDSKTKRRVLSTGGADAADSLAACCGELL